MKEINKPLCIIPASGASQRLPKKNIKELNGKPLVMYAVEAARRSNVFSKICVSTEDEEVIECLKKYNVEVPFKRPSKLNSSDATVVDVCLHALSFYEEKGIKYKSFGVLLVTSPLRTEKDVNGAYNIFKEKNVNYVMSITPFRHPPLRSLKVENGKVKPYFGMETMTKAQKLPQMYRHDGSVVFAKSKHFKKNKSFYSNKTAPYFIPPEKGIDIDNEIDLKEAEFLMNYLQNKD